MTAPQDAPAGPVPGERTKIVDALAELMFVGRDGTYADWQQRPLREQAERVGALLSSAREEGAAAERERIKPLIQRMGVALITVEHNLDTPYPDDPRWTPWSRWVSPAIRALRSAVGLS